MSQEAFTINGSDYTRQRLVEIWCVLNAKGTPRDMPLGMTKDELFAVISRKIPKSELLALWNGNFKHGLNIQDYIYP